MAQRPLFTPCSDGLKLVQEIDVNFKWNAGLATIQKKKNIVAMHEAAALEGYAHLLEISTKSEHRLGVRMSAFNLSIELTDGTTIPLECAFQGSKVFEMGGPYNDIYKFDSRRAKKDGRIRNSGNIIGFDLEGFEFSSEPKTAFYDWLYIKALAPHEEYLQRLESFAGFTDIEFNPKRSINCQARSCALFVSLSRKGLIQQVANNSEYFLEVTAANAFAQPYSDDTRQGELL